jgi:membrane-associated phospholipid phosphatase
MRRDLRLFIISLPLVLVVVAAGYYFYDLPVTAVCTGRNDQITAFSQVVTRLGLSTWYLIGSALLYLYFVFGAPSRPWANRMIYFFCAVAASGLLTNVVKWLMGRWRPKVFIPEGFYGFEFFGFGYEQTSFPSGHATTICTAAVALSLFFPRFRWLWIILALLVCISRVIIGAHYLSDVIMGAYIGIFVAFLLRKWPLFEKSIKGEIPS